MDLFGCFSLATVVLRMQKMACEDRAELEHQIERILDSGAGVQPAHAEQRSPTFPAHRGPAASSQRR